MNNNEAKLYVRNYDNYVQVFGLDVFTKCLEPFDMEKFSIFKYVVRDGGEDHYFASHGYPVLCDNTIREFEEWKGEWMRKVRKPAREYRVPNQYQLAEKDLLLSCLLEAFPYLKDFTFPTYHLDRADDEIYIKTENGESLYVPIRALTEKDFSIIEKHMNEYFKWYYSTPDRKQYLDKALATLETETAKRLKAILEG
jgi:hypothetical protein